DSSQARAMQSASTCRTGMPFISPLELPIFDCSAAADRLSGTPFFNQQSSIVNHMLTFKTQAGCGSNSSGRSGSLIDTPPFATLNLTGAVDPTRVTDLTPVTSWR